MILRKICIFILLLSASIYGDEFNGKIYLFINGHAHTFPDIFAEQFLKVYLETKGSMESEMVGQKFDGNEILWLGLNKRITKIKFSNDTDPEVINVKIKIKDNRAKVKNNFGRFRIGFDLVMKIKAVREINDLGVVLRVTEAEYTAEKIHSVTGGFVSLFDWFVTFCNWIKTMIESDFKHIATSSGSLDSLIGKPFTLIPISMFNESSRNNIVEGADPAAEAESILKSVPMDISFSYLDIDEITNIRYGFTEQYEALVINVKFLHGYYQDDQFINIYEEYSPEPVTDNIIDWGGFGYNGDKYLFTNHWDPNLTWEERVDLTFQTIADMGLNHVRVEAVWKDVVPEIDNIDPSLNPDLISETDISNYCNDINSWGGWYKIDYIINSATEHGLIPYVIVGCGHSDRPPKYQGKIIAPGDKVRGANTDKYIAVPKNVYLYWLKLYTRAVVRHCSNVQYWQAENELNGARFTEVYDWWRKGNAWTEDQEEGFQDEVAELLYNSIKIENNGAQVIQDFHIFNLAKRLKDWRDWYDIVGLNFYPNEVVALPVFGYMNGELVWAVRRILKYLGEEYGTEYGNKQVWIIETGYGAKEEAGTDIPENFDENILFYSQERQQQYLEDAINSCAYYGADAFNWFLLTTKDEIGSFNTLSDINNFIGLFDKYGNTKLGYQTFIDAFSVNSNGEIVSLNNKYETELLCGTLSIDGVFNGIESGSSFRLNGTNTYTIKTDREWLPRSDSTDLVKHHDWNGEESNHSLSRECVFNIDGSVQNAQFKYTYPVYFSVDINGENVIEVAKKINIRDPWFVDAYNKQPNEFFSLENTTDTTIYQVFLNQNDKFEPDKPIYRLKAPQVVATENDILVFDHWESSGPNDAVFSPDGDITTTNRETPVVFKNSNATVTAKYRSALQAPGETVFISDGEEVTIPAGGEYNITPGADGISNFGFYVVNGSLVIDGTKDNPVIFKVNNALPSDKWRGIKLVDQNSEAILNNVVIENAQCELTFFSISVFSGNLILEECRISNLPSSVQAAIKIFPGADAEISKTLIEGNWTQGNIGIECDLNNNYSTVKIINNTIVNFDTGIKADITGTNPSLDIRNNIIDYNNAASGTKGIDLSYSTLTNTFLNYNLINGYTSSGLEQIPWAYKDHCIFNEDPLFNDPDNGDFTLQSVESPAHDAGDPDPRYNDPDYTRNDMGAFYYDATPAIPSGFIVTGSAGEHPLLTWNPNTEPDLNHYNIYRRLTDSQSTYYLIATTTENTYTDADIIIASSGGRKVLNPSACYRVSAVDNVSNESDKTAPKCKPYLPEKPVIPEELIPDQYALHPAYPNPFNPETTIDYDLPEDVHVSILIYDITGKLIRTLVDANQTAGYKTIIWDGTNDNASPVSSGTYLIRIQAGNYSKIIKCVLLR